MSDINSFNIEEFDANLKKALEAYSDMISKFPEISKVYDDLSTLTHTEDNSISRQMKKLSTTTTTLHTKCKNIGSRFEGWLNNYRDTIIQNDSELLSTIQQISQNLASYKEQLNSMGL